MVDEMKETDFWKAVFAEFLASMLFLLNIVIVACASGIGVQQSVSASTVSIGIGIAFSITTLAQAIGHVSGGHINPAVTVGMIAIKKISIIKGFLYIIAQMLGGKNSSYSKPSCIGRIELPNGDIIVVARKPSFVLEQETYLLT